MQFKNPLQSDASVERIDEVMERAEREAVRFVNLQFIDIVGNVKSVTIPVAQFRDGIENGKWFDGSSIEGFARVAESDMYLLPDLRTFQVIPWEREGDTTARVICWVHNPTGELFPGDPRAVLARMLSEAADLGYIFNAGPEIEFFLFRPREGEDIQPLPHDRAGYFDFSTDLGSAVRKAMVNALEEMGIKVESTHHEVADGQHEIDFEYADALTAADNTVTFKSTLKAIAQKHHLHATFMPKPIYGINGSGMHTHQSLFDRNGTNLFFDPADEYGLSSIAKHFIAGQLHHARALSIIVAPLVNSYKRLVPGYEAPVYVSWARVNRSALIRVPKISLRRPEATRAELRCPDPSCNPYLAFAAMLATGLDGIRRKLPLPEPVEENLYAFGADELARRQISFLPGSLGEALSEFRESSVLRAALGPHVYERFLEAKTIEWNDYRTHVSPWELNRYLEEY